MRARLQTDAKQIGDLDLSLTVTMKIAEWELLLKQISEPWPGWKFASVVKKAIRNVEAATAPVIDGCDVED